MEDDPVQLLQLTINPNVSSIEIIIIGIILIILLFLSGIISGGEVSFFSFSSQQIVECASSENRKDRLIAKLLMDPKRLLATILISNNLVNVSMVTLSTFLTWELIGKHGFWAFFVPTVAITVLIVFFGEILPKVFANNNRKMFAYFSVNLLNFFNSIFYFLAYPLTRFSSVLEKRIDNKGYDISVEQMNQAIELASDEKTTEEEKDILKGIVNFSNIQVRQIMKSRTDIACINSNDDFHEVMDKINKAKFSRIPVYTDTLDHLEGMLHVKDLLPYLANDEKFNWKILLRKIYYVPESKMIDDLMRSFQEKHVHMAVVVDEYGGTCGLITLEDIIEEIVGEINDEFDKTEIEYQQIDQNVFVFEGKTLLADITKILDLKHDIFEPVKGENETLGGLILELHSSMPKANEEITYSNFFFKVEAVNARRIKRIRLTILDENSNKNISESED
jgi:putative hemolysin